MDAKSRRWIWMSGLSVFALVSVLRLVSGGTDMTAFLIALVIVALICVCVFPWLVGRLTKVTKNAQAQRPGAVVIPGYSASEMLDVAAAAGANPKGLSGQGGSPVAIVVLPHAYEVWVRTETEPRWSVPRGPRTEIGVVKGIFGARSIDCAAVMVEGLPGLVVIPAYRPIRNSGGSDRAGLERAMAELGGTAVAQQGKL